MQLENLVYETEKYSPLYATGRYAALIQVDGADKPSVQRELIIFINEDQKDSGKNCQKISGGMFCCARGTGDFWEQAHTAGQIFSYLKQNQLHAGSYMIENLIVDHSITDVPEERLYEFQVRASSPSGGKLEFRTG